MILLRVYFPLSSRIQHYIKLPKNIFFKNLLHSIGAFRYQEAFTAFNKAKEAKLEEEVEEEKDDYLIEALELEVERLSIYRQSERSWNREDLLNDIKLFDVQNINLSNRLMNKVKIIEEELNNGALIFPNSTYLYAAYKGKVKIVVYLLNHGAELRAKDKVYDYADLFDLLFLNITKKNIFTSIV